MKNVVKYIFQVCARAYFRLRFFWPVWFYVLNRRPRQLFLNNIPLLNDIQKRIVEDLSQTGIAVTHIDELFPDRNFFDTLEGYTQNLIAKRGTQTKKSKPFLEYLWDEVPTLDMKNPFMPFALEQRIIDIINTYIGMYTRFYYSTLNITTPIDAHAKERASQRWHRDPEDKKQCKVFLYLSDVGENAGPFCYMRHTTYGHKWGNYFCQQPPRGYYPAEGLVEKILPREEMKICTGRKGTMIFCDTTGLHRGGYATAQQRLMFTAGYVTQASASPPLYRLDENFLQKNSSNNAIRFALTPHHTPFATFIYYRYKRMQRKKVQKNESDYMA